MKLVYYKLRTNNKYKVISPIQVSFVSNENGAQLINFGTIYIILFTSNYDFLGRGLFYIDD